MDQLKSLLADETKALSTSDLLMAGFNVEELREVGVSAKDLFAAADSLLRENVESESPGLEVAIKEVSPKRMSTAGYSLAELTEAGFDISEID